MKMNVLLFAPALLVLLLVRHGLPGTIKLLSVCAAIQVNTPKYVSFQRLDVCISKNFTGN